MAVMTQPPDLPFQDFFVSAPGLVPPGRQWDPLVYSLCSPVKIVWFGRAQRQPIMNRKIRETSTRGMWKVSSRAISEAGWNNIFWPDNLPTPNQSLFTTEHASPVSQGSLNDA